MSHPDDEDPAALFRAAIGEVKPLRKDAEPAPAAPRPKPRARMAERDEAEAAGEFARLLRDSAPLEAGDVASYRRDNLPPRLFQRLNAVLRRQQLRDILVAQENHERASGIKLRQDRFTRVL